MSELERIQKIGQVTGAIENWKGLHSVLLGLWFMPFGIVMKWPFPQSIWAIVVGFAVFFLGYKLVEHYYSRQFGVVSKPKESEFARLVRTRSAWILFAILMTLNIFDPKSYTWISVPVMLAFFMFRGALTGGLFRGYYIAMGLVYCLFLLYAYFSDLNSNWVFVAGGLGFVVLGLLDHYNFVRLFKPLPKEDPHATA